MAYRRNIVSEVDGSRSQSVGRQESLAVLEAKHKQELEERLNKYRNENIRKQSELELKLKQAGIKETSAEYKKAIKKAEDELEKNRQLQRLKNLNEYYEMEQSLIKENAEIESAARKHIMTDSSYSFADKLNAAKGELASSANRSKMLSFAVSNTLNQLNSILDKYVSFQSGVNARLQGSGRTFTTAETLLSTAVGIQPYVKTESMISKLSELVDTGVAYNLEMRAFLGTVSENIASTFNIANASLLRIVRLQQQDSSAARLGVEASLTRFLNGMYQNTEYLSTAYDNVQTALLEASSTMTGDEAIQFEYQVQKWLGSLYSVGMSDTTVSGLAQALGYLGSGNISALSSSQYQNLLVMAASRAGMNYSDLLVNGLNSGSTNVLLASMTEYLKEISNGTNQVVKSELARTFGVSMSDLTAAMNLNTDELRTISSRSMNTASALGELSAQLALLPLRVSGASQINTLWSNMMWSMGSGVAENPMLSAMWKVTDLIQSTTGGINLPFTLALAGGTGVGIDLNTTVDNLIKLGIVGAGSLGMIGDLVSGLSSSVLPTSMYWKLFGASELANMAASGVGGLLAKTSGLSSSSTVYAGNASGSDIAAAATQGAYDEETADVDTSENDKDLTDMTDLIQQDVSRIYELLSEVVGVNGIKLDNYGLSTGI